MSILQLILSLVAITVNVVAALRLWSAHPRRWTSRLVWILCLTCSLYVVANYFSLNHIVPGSDGQLFWVRAVMAISVLNGPLFLVLSHVFPLDELKLPRAYLVSLAALAVLAAVLAMTPLLFSGIYLSHGLAATVSGPALPFWTAVSVGSTMLAVGVSVRRYFRAVAWERGAIIGYILGLVASTSLMYSSAFIGNVVLHSSATVFVAPLALSIFFVTTERLLSGVRDSSRV